MSNFKIRMHTLILGTLLPSLLIITCVAGVLIYSRIRDVISEGFDQKLFAVSSTSAAFVDGDVHQAILAQKPSEESRTYLQYVAPMRRILNKAECKYVYSQIVGPTSDPKQNITYVLDATVGDAHSHIGDNDVTPADERIGCEAVQAGRLAHYLTGMRQWKQWGLLSSCFTPIFNHAGKIVAMMGTDVDVNIVYAKTNALLERVAFVSIICILLGAILAMRVARRLTQPIAVVKDGALLVAAGQYGHRIEIRQPTELADLARSFNKLSTALAATVEELSNANRELEQRRRSQELRRLLADTVDVNGAESQAASVNGIYGKYVAAGRIGNRNMVASNSGYVFSADGTHLIIWLSHSAADQLQNARMRAEIAQTAERLLVKNAERPSATAADLAALFPSVNSVLSIDSEARTVRSSARVATPAVVIDTTGDQPKTIDLASTEVFSLKPGQSLIMGQGDIARYATILSRTHSGGDSTAAGILSRIVRTTESLETEEIVAVLVA